ncbi:MAG: hypothetical protein R3C09_27595 [Pirellulaceae bacterium]
MTKTRHRIFEIFDSAEEARGALATKSAILQTNTGDPQSWSLRQLAASQSAGIVHVKFKKAEVSSADTVRDSVATFLSLLEVWPMAVECC